MAKNKSVAVADEIVLTDGEELTVSFDADEISDAIAEIETDEVKREAYAEQPAEMTAETLSEEAVEPKAKKVRTPRLSLVTAKASEIISASAAAMGGLHLTLDATLDSGTLESVDKLDKKTREKAVNLVHSMAANKRPSVYTVQAVKALRDAGGTLSLKALTDFYMTKCSYKPGTARRQASEMFSLFPTFLIAHKDSGKGTPLVLNEDSVILKYIEASATPAA